MSSLFSSSEKSTTNQTTKPIIPDNIQSALDAVLSGAQSSDIFNIAGFTPDEQAAFDLIRNSVGASTPGYDASTAYATGLLNPTGGISSADISAFMNPYVNEVVDPSIRALRDEAARQNKSLQDQAITSGAFGGSRLGLEEANLNNALMQGVTDTTYKGYSDAYNNAIQTALASKGLGLQGANALAGISTDMQKASLTDAAALQNIGETQRAMNQSQLDLPLTQNKYVGSVLASLAPMQIGSQTDSVTESKSTPSLMSSLVGAGMAAAGIWNPAMFAGGGGLSSLLGSAGGSSAAAGASSGFNFGGGWGFADGGPVPSVGNSPKLWEVLAGKAGEMTPAQEQQSKDIYSNYQGNIRNMLDWIGFSDLTNKPSDSPVTKTIRNVIREKAGMAPALEPASVPNRPSINFDPSVASNAPYKTIEAANNEEFLKSLGIDPKVAREVASKGTQKEQQTQEKPTAKAEDTSSFWDNFKGQEGINKPLLAAGLALMASGKNFPQALGEAGLVGLQTAENSDKIFRDTMEKARKASLEERQVAAQEMNARSNALKAQAAMLKDKGFSDSNINVIMSTAAKFLAADTNYNTTTDPSERKAIEDAAVSQAERLVTGLKGDGTNTQDQSMGGLAKLNAILGIK